MSAQTQDSQLADIWASAIVKYRQDTKQDLLHVSLEVDSPKALLEIIDKEMKHFKEYRRKWERTRAVVISLLEMAASLSEMVSEGLTTLCPPMKVVSIAIRKLCGAAGRLSAYYDMVTDIFDEMNGFLRRLPVYTKQKTTGEFERILVDTLAQLLVTLGAVIKSLKNRYCLQLLKILGGRDAKVKEAMDRLKKVSSQEAPMVMAHVLANVVEAANDYRDNAERLLRKEEEELYKDIHSWLHPPDASTNHNVASEARQKGTGDWLVQGREFLDWSKNPNSFLWIHEGLQLD